MQTQDSFPAENLRLLRLELVGWKRWPTALPEPRIPLRLRHRPGQSNLPGTRRESGAGLEYWLDRSWPISEHLKGCVPKGRSAGEDFADDILDGRFLDIDVDYRQFIEEGLADRDDPVSRHLQFDAGGGVLDNLAIAPQIL
jgi:hypothetical protein